MFQYHSVVHWNCEHILNKTIKLFDFALKVPKYLNKSHVENAILNFHPQTKFVILRTVYTIAVDELFKV